ncbi:MAG: polysaccharide deacetylase family protein [Chitinophagaceae bacterium]
MLNFRNTTILFIILLVASTGYDALFNLPASVYFIIAFAYFLFLFYGSYFVGSGFFIKVICSATTGKKVIAITFDDGPATSYTPEILDLLREHKVETAFFCIGSRIAGNEELFQRLHAEGHIIGNHSFSHHFWFDLFSAKKMLADLERMDREMEKLTGLRPRFFRPPYGVTNPNLRKAIEKGNYIPVGWSIRSMDTVIKDKNKLLNKINRLMQPGAIILFHDTSKTTRDILPAFIRQCRENGYEIKRLDKMLTLNAYA